MSDEEENDNYVLNMHTAKQVSQMLGFLGAVGMKSPSKIDFNQAFPSDLES